jgi:NADPH:quinone reductase-like Zn-dependent oxidoreductase
VVDIFDALPDNSVDIVYDNYGADGTADKAMPKIRPGGVYLMMPHGQCFESKSQKPPCVSANPKPGVSQVNYDTSVDFEKYALAGLDELRDLVNSGGVKPHIDQRFSLSNVKDALAYSAGPGSGGVGDHIGKISITF